jgi:hypothetical protein
MTTPRRVPTLGERLRRCTYSDMDTEVIRASVLPLMSGSYKRPPTVWDRMTSGLATTEKARKCRVVVDFVINAASKPSCSDVLPQPRAIELGAGQDLAIRHNW